MSVPIYEFKCEQCSQQFESLMRPRDPVVCPHCKGTDLKECMTAPATYRIRGDNSASTSPRTALVNETERREGKRDRVSKMYEKDGVKFE